MNRESCRLSAYIDGELGPAERKQVEEHLAGCPECAGKIEEFKRQGDILSRAGGGLLLHVDLARQVAAELPSKRRSLVMASTQGVRRRLSFAGFGVALAFAIFSLVRTGPDSVMTMATQPLKAAFFLNWALMICAGSMLVWPDKLAVLEARVWAFVRGGRPQVTARERMLTQAAGLLFLGISVALNYLLLNRHSLGI